MREFKVLPTDDRFINMTEQQIDFIIGKMEQDIRRKSGKGNVYADSDDGWMEDDEMELDEGLDIENVLEQVGKQHEDKDNQAVTDRLKALRQSIELKPEYDAKVETDMQKKLEYLRENRTQDSEDDDWI